MEIKKEDPSKVIIVPRPPRSMDPELVPLEPADAAENVAEEEVEEEEVTPVTPTTALENPGFDPKNNQVEGPAAGLAGGPVGIPKK